MNVVQTINLFHEDNTKEREWDFHQYGIAGKLMDLLVKNFPHYLYEDSDKKWDDLREGKNFELTLIAFRKEGTEIDVMTPSIYFKSEGYRDIVWFIDKQYEKVSQ